MWRTDSLEKTLILGKIEGRRRRGRRRMRWSDSITDFNWHEFGWTPGVDDGQGGLACCNSWGHKESDTTERLIWSDLIILGWPKSSFRFFMSAYWKTQTNFLASPIQRAFTVKKENDRIFSFLWRFPCLEHRKDSEMSTRKTFSYLYLQITTLNGWKWRLMKSQLG